MWWPTLSIDQGFFICLPMGIVGRFKTCRCRGTSLAVLWLRLRTENAGGMSSIPSWRTRILHATRSSQKIFF